MARKQQPTEPKRATLQTPRPEAEARIRKQIEKGQKLLELRIGNSAELEQARNEKRKWSDFNAELLRRIVDTDELVNDYYPTGGFVSWGPVPFAVQVKEFYSDVQDYVTRLESILGRLELISESPVLARPTKAQPTASHPEVSRRVFVVHGHDEEAKQSAARCLEKLELEAIILHEQPSRGRTIIEKFEDYADVGFAVVLLTPDDLGVEKGEIDNLRPRARQNVVFELGFFVGKLGRQRVCALHRGDVEIPSDCAGVLWVPMEPGGAWRFALGREIKEAGLDVDLNKLA
jgi:predicted nucleotide-binding protein